MEGCFLISEGGLARGADTLWKPGPPDGRGGGNHVNHRGVIARGKHSFFRHQFMKYITVFIIRGKGEGGE